MISFLELFLYLICYFYLYYLYYYNNVIKYDVINKFYYKKYKQIPKIIKIVLSFNCKNLNIKQLISSLVALELISSKRGLILVSKKSNILLKRYVIHNSKIGFKKFYLYFV
mgnify:CR=1 FL=1